MKARSIFLILLIVFIACDDRQKPMRNVIRAPASTEVETYLSTGVGTYLVLDSDSPPIYWTEYDFRSRPHSVKIQRLDGTNLQDIISDFAPDTFVTILAVDVGAGKIYYHTQNPSENKAYRANLDGSNIQILVEANVSRLAVHGGKIYWAEFYGNFIHTVNQDLSNYEKIAAGPSVEAIAIDTQSDKIYWAIDDIENPSPLDYRYFKRKIQRANLDGSNIQDIVTGLDLPDHMAVDSQKGKIYWVDRITDKIQRANLDGSNVQDIVILPEQSSTSISLDVQRGKIYWAGWTNIGLEIYRANLDGSNIQTVVHAGTPNAKFSGNSFHVVPPHDKL
ncbi:MAG: DUF5050 domain-containing protein [Candidatus Poribacteria bacterium]|nr:DUF5050 domain-containing protein [Candidatus Poribacteria bacterium]